MMDSEMAIDLLTSSVSGARQPWPLLLNRPFGYSLPPSALAKPRSVPAVLRLVVHGRSGGEIPACLTDLAADLALRRGAPVELEALTADPLPSQPGVEYWLMPLLLLPGSHVRSDLPAILRRMRAGGSRVTPVPFLGAWSGWWRLLRLWIEAREGTGQQAVVVHHPLRPGLSARYLAMLQRELGCTLVSADTWEAHLREHPSACPLPLALAPNRMAESLRQAGGLPSLLDDPQLRSGLITLLSVLS